MIDKEALIEQGFTVREWSLRDPANIAAGESHGWPWRSAWGPGPWENEPDRVLWIKPGSKLPRLALRNGHGNWCGYVGLTPDHPSFGHGMKDWEYEGAPSVHGGVTYSEECAGHICHVPEPGEPEHVWWIGFDCCHAGDYSPGNRVSAIDGPGTYVEPPAGADWRMARYRTLDYVVGQCESLAEQLEVND